MNVHSHHQCLIYDGSPSRHLPAMAALLRQKLRANHRCLYLNSPAMVAGMRSYLAATGLDIAHEIGKASLVLSSDQRHLMNGCFDVDRMLYTLEDALQQALNDGYDGLWATGDMSWEFGPEKDFSKLLEYEWRLEGFFRTHPSLGGVCQYHADTLPREALRQGLLAHQSVFINETLSLINPSYLPARAYSDQAILNPELEGMISKLTASLD